MINLNKLLVAVKNQSAGKKLPERAAVYILGLFVASFGVAFAVNSRLGISPMNSFPYVLSRIFGVDMGITVIAVLVFFVLLQIAILRRDFKWINVTQIIFALIFGYFVDLTAVLIGEFSIPTYAGQLLMMAIGFTLVATGITMYVGTNLVALPYEGIVLAVAQKTGHKFHLVMIAVHSMVVLTGVILSLGFLGGLYGVREGTVISAVMVGKIIPYTRRYLRPLMVRIGIAAESKE